LPWGIALLLVFFFNARIVLAQSDRATITGTVKDVSGALVAGAPVVVTNPKGEEGFRLGRQVRTRARGD
jgi:hypothetical protein